MLELFLLLVAVLVDFFLSLGASVLYTLGAVCWVVGQICVVRYGMRVVELHSLAASLLAYIQWAKSMTRCTLLDDLLGLALSL